MLENIKNYFVQLQKNIADTLEIEDGQGKFLRDNWQSRLGEGKTFALENGQHIERAGVNFSHVTGEHLPSAATERHPELANCPFVASGVSVIVHPRNPYAPTSHFNVRYFQARQKNGENVFWFGGGFDLTPCYGFEEDCINWHQAAKSACDPFGETLYPRFKKWADEYYFLPHRQEARGIGGLFFDDFNELGLEKTFEFIQSVGTHYLQAYQAILARRKNTKFGERERDFQLYRRGRYVEFNLLYDRGTRFGLQFGGRIESILISLPSCVNWRYQWQPEIGSPEARLKDYFLLPRDWLAN